ncbi:MAG: aminoglycoside phosphotransferase family protein [Eubacteriales bacterium]|nr:aminoglycoside phosphotransferase family protein [Eubacteriales bacterium]
MVEAARMFLYNGTPVECRAFGNGHINRSFLVETDAGKRYVLQSLSTQAFHDIPGLMDNTIAVSSYIRNKTGDPRSSLIFVPAADGKYYYLDSNGEYWRSYEFVEDTFSPDAPGTMEDFYNSAVAFGTFQNLLSDFPAETLCETIPDFHNTPDRYRKFHEKIDADPLGRVKEVAEEIRFALEREEDAGRLQRMRESGELPLRVTHNDTKLTNVLFDKETGKPVCVIDLDTVMPGLSALDFGDAIRFGASTGAEDEKDLSKVNIDLDKFRAFAKGFISSCPALTDAEINALVLGAKTITLEQGVRFLDDYINGDVYYATSYPGQNLYRTRTQFRLVSEMEKHWDELQEIIKETLSEL